MLQADVSVGCVQLKQCPVTRGRRTRLQMSRGLGTSIILYAHITTFCLYIASHVMFMNPTCTGKVGRSEGARRRRMADDGHEIFLDFWRERADETAPNRFFRAKPPLQSFTVMV